MVYLIVHGWDLWLEGELAVLLKIAESLDENPLFFA